MIRPNKAYQTISVSSLLTEKLESLITEFKAASVSGSGLRSLSHSAGSHGLVEKSRTVRIRHIICLQGLLI